jgi:signal recognition particle subunit SRP54
LEQLGQVKKMGSLGGLMKLMPGVTKEMRSAASNVDDKELSKVEGIVHAMTPNERRNPAILNASRRTRIARGAGTTVPAVNQLLRQFTEMQKMMRQMAGGSMPNLPGGFGRMAAMAQRQAQQGQLPDALSGLASTLPKPAGGPKGKKKKGGRVTPPKPR